MKKEIIKRIENDLMSTSEVADALGKTGCIGGVLPINPRLHRVGEVAFVYSCNGTNWHTHKQVEKIENDRIVYVHGLRCEDVALFGHLVTRYLFQSKNARAVVLNGLVRDVADIISDNYPVWATGISPIGAVNYQKQITPAEKATLNDMREKFEGGIILCDDTGVVLIEKEHHTKEFMDKLDFIRNQEATWYKCLDEGMTTFEIVCEKRYLNAKAKVK